jgi:hypothetical protein
VATREIPREDPGCESEAGRIGQLDRLILVVEGQHAQDRPEEFLYQTREVAARGLPYAAAPPREARAVKTRPHREDL